MKRPVLAFLRYYKRAISPLLPPSCRFHPTCSEYAYEAVEKHGVIKGGRLATWRLLRCNPFCTGGWDPVP
jgi:putative membrane protein insertion efficiency factor